MCVIAWNWQPAQSTPLRLLANRDELYARPALPVHWWPGNQVLAGRDLQGGGTWLGVSRSGRLAALTNYRVPAPDTAVRPSRGMLVADFLQSNDSANRHLQSVALRADEFQAFNLLVYDGVQLMGLESRHRRIFTVSPGIGGVSNADFDTPWPKLVRLKSGLAQTLRYSSDRLQHDLSLLQDARRAVPEELPNTGIERAWEEALSAIFITQPSYGTRASSIVLVGQKSVTFEEQSYDPSGPTQLLNFSFDLRHIVG